MIYLLAQQAQQVAEDVNVTVKKTVEQTDPAVTFSTADKSGLVIAITFAAVVIILLLMVIVILSITNTLNAIPGKYRSVDAGLAWLLLIPGFNYFWAFYIVNQLASSYRRYMKATGAKRTGDGGQGIGMAFAGAATIGLIPQIAVIFVSGSATTILAIVAGVIQVVSIVLLVLWLGKIREVKGKCIVAAKRHR